MGPVICTRRIVCGCARVALWDILTDTDTVNRAAGMHRLEVSPLNDASAARFLAATRLGGFPVQYAEEPYEWAYLETFSVRRVLRQGPVKTLHMQFVLDARDGGGTLVTLRLTLAPRRAVMRPAIRVSGELTLRALGRAVRQLDARAGAAGAAAAAARPELEEWRMRAAILTLSTTEDLGLVRRLETMLREGDDALLRRIRPFVLADAWGADQDRVLHLCLLATRAGILAPRWDLVCPSCRGPSERLASPKDVPSHGGCQLCDLQYPSIAEEALELSFTAHPALRTVEAATFCLGGPARTPHVVAQAILRPGSVVNLRAPTRPGRYRLFLRGGASTALFARPDGGAQVSVSSRDIGTATLPDVETGGIVQVQHSADTESHVKLEVLEWALQAVNLRHLMGVGAELRAAVGA